jgi:hypothetical protein
MILGDRPITHFRASIYDSTTLDYVACASNASSLKSLRLPSEHREAFLLVANHFPLLQFLGPLDLDGPHVERISENL